MESPDPPAALWAGASDAHSRHENHHVAPAWPKQTRIQAGRPTGQVLLLRGLWASWDRVCHA